MREALLTACPVIVWLITAMQGLFMLLAFRGWKRTRERFNRRFEVIDGKVHEKATN